ncbi:uncharacterized protein F5147DRAFT_649847 [Suillus discolor]|uniref:JmjC domain-containing protein n=1 Tax=Suillus discolor TaxID=1912936 RepID=A0A9P7FFC8_9AGAM|nr:uncharacterized protein F5147DRAFT_649847 [Suillus discolor]KAG2114684.1 hypothetical protein F5147DRAFT_649847 [Suillus discolor]
MTLRTLQLDFQDWKSNTNATEDGLPIRSVILPGCKNKLAWQKRKKEEKEMANQTGIADSTEGQGPPKKHTLDSGIINGWNQTTVDCPIGEKVHLDNFTIHSWTLVHSPTYWTHLHHDLDAPELTDLYQNRKKIQETWHGEIVTLLSSDMLIQPPGQFHAVYTPVTLFATGGHFYNYETMHLTELSQYIDHKQGRTLTNQVHEHSLENFQRMVINLLRISHYINCNKYVATSTEKPKFKTNTTKLVHEKTLLCAV